MYSLFVYSEINQLRTNCSSVVIFNVGGLLMSAIYSRLVLAEIKMELLHHAHVLESQNMYELLQQVLATVKKIDAMDKDIQQNITTS